MSRRLLPCPACARHVAISEATCPFCTGALDFSGAATLPVANAPAGRRLGRAALLALGAGAAAIAACDGGQVTALYGGPAYDAGALDAADANTQADATGTAPPYGAPPYDAGPEDAGDEQDASDDADAGDGG